MKRLAGILGLSVALGLSWSRPMVAQVLKPACQLLTAQDASTLAGSPRTAQEAPGYDGCLWKSPTWDVMKPDAVEITVKELANASAAHTYFPTWIVPLPPKPATMTLIPVTDVGDEATIVHSSRTGIASIYFRKSDIVVKIGTYPAAADSALKVAARAVVARIGNR